MARTLAISCSDFLLALRRNEREHQHVEHHYFTRARRGPNSFTAIPVAIGLVINARIELPLLVYPARVVPAVSQHSRPDHAFYGWLLVCSALCRPLAISNSQ